jgi:4-amino-4-deoxy-L-arabinose transferase-like glycosyltransferase
MEKRLKIALFLAIAINFFFTLHLTPLFNLDEGAFSEATREMLKNHDFITTYLNGALRFDKPILIYWLQALSVTIFGLNEFALRLPSALAATFWAFGIYWFAKKIFDEKTGVLSAFFMVTALQIGLIAKAAIADALLNMFIAFSMFSLYLYIQNQNKKYLYFTFAFIGFGFLTKGPVAVLIPLATFFIYSLIKKDFKFFLKTTFDLKGIVLFLIIALPWYIAEYMAQGDKFIKGFFLKHNIDRFETSLEKHRGSLFYYIPVILIGMLPWTSLLLKYLTKLKNYLKEQNDFFLFGSIWFFFVFIFFSLSGTKLPHYVIYGYTPVFIFMGVAFKELKSEFLYSLPLILFVLALLILPSFALNLTKNKEAVIAIKTIMPLFNIWYYIFLGVVLILSLLKLGKENKTIILGFSMVFILNYVGWIYAHARAIPVKQAAIFAKKHNIKNVYLETNLPSFSVYFDKITPRKKAKKGEVALIKSKNTKGYKVLFKKGLVALGVKE